MLFCVVYNCLTFRLWLLIYDSLCYGPYLANEPRARVAVLEKNKQINSFGKQTNKQIKFSFDQPVNAKKDKNNDSLVVLTKLFICPVTKDLRIALFSSFKFKSVETQLC